MLQKWEFYLGGDNTNNGARFSRGKIVEFLEIQGLHSATILEAHGLFEGNQEKSWLIILILGQGELIVKNLAKAMAIHFKQNSIGLVRPDGVADFVEA